jgi:hypothetical protein
MDAARFTDALEVYRLAGELAIESEETYRVAHAEATLRSEAKNAESRKADADKATSELRLARDRAALRRDVALQMVLFLRGGGRVAA